MCKYNFSHLVLLIGTNPIPNFVVADYWLRKNQKLAKIWLIHSEANNFQAGTIDQASYLEKILKERWGENKHSSLKFPLEKIPLSDVSNAIKIQYDIKQLMIGQIESENGIHLNYTGGTKCMSTHVYWIFKDTKTFRTEFSYLDARNFRLISDDKGVIEDDLRKKVSLSLDEMIRLHGFERKNRPKDFLFAEALKYFQKLIEKDQMHEFYRSYNRKMFLDGKGNLAKEVRKLSESSKKHLEPFKPNKALAAIIQQLPETYRLFDTNGKFDEQLTNKNFEAAVKFLDGEWLEHHTKDVLQKLFMKNNTDIEHNWVIRKADWSVDPNFELDVVLINGYQLTGISCTTDSKKYCKNKGFEIIHRARQIGGDESKAVLVSRMDKNNRDKVQEELIYETGGNHENILILGEKDLKRETMLRKIKAYIFDQ